MLKLFFPSIFWGVITVLVRQVGNALSDRVVLSLFSLVVVGGEVGRLAELSSWA